jgi:hypothetical protein
LGKYVYQTALDCTVAGHHTVAEIALLLLSEVCATMTHKHVELFKRALVEKLGYALAGCIFAFIMLFLYGLFATS